MSRGLSPSRGSSATSLSSPRRPNAENNNNRTPLTSWSRLIQHQTSSMSSASAPPPPSPPGKSKPIDPILRNALRYTISAKEYQLLHQYLLSRTPVVKKRSIHPKRYDAIVKGPDDYNVAAFRAALRLGVVTLSGLKAWEVIKSRLLSRGTVKRCVPSICLLFFSRQRRRVQRDLGIDAVAATNPVYPYGSHPMSGLAALSLSYFSSTASYDAFLCASARAFSAMKRARFAGGTREYRVR